VVAQGHRTFVVSWRNPDASHAQVSWDDYIEQGAIQAIEVVRDIAKVPQINALGILCGRNHFDHCLGRAGGTGRKTGQQRHTAHNLD